MVRMADRLTFGTSMADWQERINVDRMRRERQEKAREVMRRANVPALLAAGSPNTRFLTGLTGAEFLPQLWWVLFFAEGEPIVFMHAGWYHNYPPQAPWITEWRLARSWLGAGCGPIAAQEEAKKFAADIHRELQARGCAREPLGVVGFDGLAMRSLAELNIQTVDGWALMLEATKTKTVDEINCLKQAYAISDAAWFKAWQLLRPGIRESDVGREAMLAAHQAGAHEIPPAPWKSGPCGFERGYTPMDRILTYGDLAYGVFCHLGYMGYKTCYYRTFSIGRKPDQKAQDWYKEMIDRLDRVIDEIKPGNTTADAAKHFPPASKWGYSDEAEVLTMEIGHGVGLYHYGYPIINRQWSLEHPQEFEVGMTIAIESREGEPGVGGVRIEDTVVVTENGAELLDFWPRDEILVAPLI